MSEMFELHSHDLGHYAALDVKLMGEMLTQLEKFLGDMRIKKRTLTPTEARQRCCLCLAYLSYNFIVLYTDDFGKRKESTEEKLEEFEDTFELVTKFLKFDTKTRPYAQHMVQARDWLKPLLKVSSKQNRGVEAETNATVRYNHLYPTSREDCFKEFFSLNKLSRLMFEILYQDSKQDLEPFLSFVSWIFSYRCFTLADLCDIPQDKSNSGVSSSPLEASAVGETDSSASSSSSDAPMDQCDSALDNNGSDVSSSSAPTCPSSDTAMNQCDATLDKINSDVSSPLEEVAEAREIGSSTSPSSDTPMNQDNTALDKNNNGEVYSLFDDSEMSDADSPMSTQVPSSPNTSTNSCDIESIMNSEAYYLSTTSETRDIISSTSSTSSSTFPSNANTLDKNERTTHLLSSLAISSANSSVTNIPNENRSVATKLASLPLQHTSDKSYCKTATSPFGTYNTALHSNNLHTNSAIPPSTEPQHQLDLDLIVGSPRSNAHQNPPSYPPLLPSTTTPFATSQSLHNNEDALHRFVHTEQKETPLDSMEAHKTMSSVDTFTRESCESCREKAGFSVVESESESECSKTTRAPTKKSKKKRTKNNNKQPLPITLPKLTRTPLWDYVIKQGSFKPKSPNSTLKTISFRHRCFVSLITLFLRQYEVYFRSPKVSLKILDDKAYRMIQLAEKDHQTKTQLQELHQLLQALVVKGKHNNGEGWFALSVPESSINIESVCRLSQKVLNEYIKPMISESNEKINESNEKINEKHDLTLKKPDGSEISLKKSYTKNIGYALTLKAHFEFKLEHLNQKLPKDTPVTLAQQ